MRTVLFGADGYRVARRVFDLFRSVATVAAPGLGPPGDRAISRHRVLRNNLDLVDYYGDQYGPRRHRRADRGELSGVVTDSVGNFSARRRIDTVEGDRRDIERRRRQFCDSSGQVSGLVSLDCLA